MQKMLQWQCGQVVEVKREQLEVQYITTATIKTMTQLCQPAWPQNREIYSTSFQIKNVVVGSSKRNDNAI